jgi:hypothetical protein
MRNKPKCGNKCPYWHFTLRFPIGLGPVCKKWKLPLFVARDKCFALTGAGRARKRKKAVKKRTIPQQPKKQIQANPWQGVNRGWGAITK